MRKKITLILGIILGLAIVSLTVYLISMGRFSFLAAGTNTRLYLNPSTGNNVVGKTFDVNIVFDSDGKAIDVVDIRYLHYNSSLLEVQDSDGATAGVQIKPGTIFNSYSGNLVDPTNGRIAISGLVGGGSAGFNGSGVFATITFKALMAGSTALAFDYTVGSGIDANAWEHGTALDVLSAANGANYNLILSAETNLNITLQGRTNYSGSTINLKVYPVGQRTTPLFEKSDIVTNNTGKSSFQIVGLNNGNYDFQLKVPYYLTMTLTNVAISTLTTLNLNYSNLRAGDLNNDNIINGGDYTVMNGKWFTNDTISDINQDTLVNGGDFAIINSNWFIEGT